MLTDVEEVHLRSMFERVIQRYKDNTELYCQENCSVLACGNILTVSCGIAKYQPIDVPEKDDG